MKTVCTCKVGPGKFEGEPVSTFLAWDIVMNGGDEQIGAYSFVKFPLEPDKDARENAGAYGYCSECIATVDCVSSFGLVLSERDSGFIDGTILETETDWNTAIEQAESDAETESDADGY